MRDATLTPGHVILLNGTPSAGKTTIARALWSELEPPHWYRSLDDFRQGYQLDQWKRDTRRLFQMTFRGYIRSIAAMASAGHHVITESVILPDTEAAYADALHGLTVFLIGVRCPLPVAEERERTRGDRVSSLVELDVPEFDVVHAGRTYDVDFDTSVVSTAEAVAMIRRRLADPAPPSAFARIEPWARPQA